jgi:hypothetical protein
MGIKPDRPLSGGGRARATRATAEARDWRQRVKAILEGDFRRTRAHTCGSASLFLHVRAFSCTPPPQSQTLYTHQHSDCTPDTVGVDSATRTRTHMHTRERAPLCEAKKPSPVFNILDSRSEPRNRPPFMRGTLGRGRRLHCMGEYCLVKPTGMA